MNKIPLDDLILYIISKLSSSNAKIGGTRIIKLLYLIDLVALRRLGKKITDIRYSYHFYGPYAQEIVDALDRIAKSDNVEVTVTPTSMGIPSYDCRMLLPISNKVKAFLNHEEKQIVDE